MGWPVEYDRCASVRRLRYPKLCLPTLFCHIKLLTLALQLISLALYRLILLDLQTRAL